jgi:hypothetical protein
MRITALVAPACAAVFVTTAAADLVDIRVEGIVSSNTISEGPLANANPGDAASLTVQVDSDDQSIVLPDLGISQIGFDGSTGVFEVESVGSFGGDPGFGLVNFDVSVGPGDTYELHVPSIFMAAAGGFQTDVRARLQGNVSSLFGPDPELLANLGTYDVTSKDFNFDATFEVTQITSDFRQVEMEMEVTRIVIAPSCPADVDGDGEVGFQDLLLVLAAWGPCPGCPEDVDGDGEVGFPDLLILLADWGPC